MERGMLGYREVSRTVSLIVIDPQTGQAVQQLEYDEFGKVLTDTNPGFQPFGYAGGLYGLALLCLGSALVCALFLHIPQPAALETPAVGAPAR